MLLQEIVEELRGVLEFQVELEFYGQLLRLRVENYCLHIDLLELVVVGEVDAFFMEKVGKFAEGLDTVEEMLTVILITYNEARAEMKGNRKHWALRKVQEAEELCVAEGKWGVQAAFDEGQVLLQFDTGQFGPSAEIFENYGISKNTTIYLGIGIPEELTGTVESMIKYFGLKIIHCNEQCETFLSPKIEEFRWKYLEDLEKYSGNLEKLLELGFGRGLALVALEITDNDVTEAVQMIYSGILPADVLGTRTGNFFFDLGEFVRETLENCLTFCVVCYEQLLEPACSMRTCSNSICETQFSERLFQGNEEYLNSDMFPLHLLLIRAALHSENASHYFPKEIPCIRDYSLMTMGHDVTISILKEDILKFSSETQNKLENLVESFGGNPTAPHKIIKFIRDFNDYSLQRLTGGELIPGVPNTFEQYKVISYPENKENCFNEFKSNYGSRFTFHGSPIEKWYSILKNGLLPLSQTELMSAGARFGNGIYSTNRFSIAINYTLRRNSRIQPFRLNEKVCVGILERIYSPHISHNIYVEEDERKIILRYLLLSNYSETCKYHLNSHSLLLSQHYNQCLFHNPITA